jgi:Flp pilus assembly protein TadG
MSTMSAAARRSTPDRSGERGQVFVIFAMSLLILVGMTGLSIDAGGAFAQRRDQQAAADLAALAAANDYLLNGDDTQATNRALAVTAENGYTHGVDGTAVNVGIDTSNGVEITVDIDADHHNTFLGVVGFPTWEVSTTAAALAGFPDSAEGAGPFIFSIGAFEDNGTPKYQTETDFGETNGDVPTSELDFAWTNYGVGNVNTSEVSDIISGGMDIDRTLEYGQYIGQHNNGNHTALFQDVNTYLSGLDLPVAVVDNNGNFMGWAMFHVTSASGGSNKHVRGYFLSSFITGRLRVTSCASGDCPRYLGTYVLKLSD